MRARRGSGFSKQLLKELCDILFNHFSPFWMFTFWVKFFPSLVPKDGDLKFIPLLFHLMVGWCSTLNVGAFCFLYFTPPLYKYVRVFCFWPRPEPIQSHMLLLEVSGLLGWLLLKLERKKKIILVGCHYLKVSQFCVLRRQPFQLKGWNWLEGSPFTMLVGGSKT